MKVKICAIYASNDEIMCNFRKTKICEIYMRTRLLLSMPNGRKIVKGSTRGAWKGLVEERSHEIIHFLVIVKRELCRLKTLPFIGDTTNFAQNSMHRNTQTRSSIYIYTCVYMHIYAPFWAI